MTYSQVHVILYNNNTVGTIHDNNNFTTCVYRLTIWHFSRRQNVTAISIRPFVVGLFSRMGVRRKWKRKFCGRPYSESASCAFISYAVLVITDVINCFQTTLRFQRNSIASTHYWGRHSRFLRSRLCVLPNSLW